MQLTSVFEGVFMVSEWEKEELGRLTLRNMKALPKAHPDSGRLTYQKLESLKGAQKKTETTKAKVKLFFERLKAGFIQTVHASFIPKEEKKAPNMCQIYGHHLPRGSNWYGAFPCCVDCGVQITDPSQLRGSLAKDDKTKFRSV